MEPLDVGDLTRVDETVSVLVGTQIEADDLGAGGGQQMDDPSADATVRAGDEKAVAHQYVALPPEMS